MNMCKIKFQVLRLSTFVFNKGSEKKLVTIIFVVKSLKGFGWNNVGRRRWPSITSALSQCIVLFGVSGAETLMRH